MLSNIQGHRKHKPQHSSSWGDLSVFHPFSCNCRWLSPASPLPLLRRGRGTFALPQSYHSTPRESKNRREPSLSHHSKATCQAGSEQGENSLFSYYMSLRVGVLLSPVEKHFGSYNCTNRLKKKNHLVFSQVTDSTPKKLYQVDILSGPSISVIIQQNFQQIIQILWTNVRWNPSTSDNLKKASVPHMGNFTFTESFFMTFYFVKRADMSL